MPNRCEQTDVIDKSIALRIDVKKPQNTYGFIDIGLMRSIIIKHGNSIIFWKMIIKKYGNLNSQRYNQKYIWIYRYRAYAINHH
ncbi:hypothetical protein HanPSC8_Chr04g0136071 [Helianthus annuus]|nr:hypothetical protein HanPSC8_Chr04g0136071 [Helianthus annuus]